MNKKPPYDELHKAHFNPTSPLELTIKKSIWIPLLFLTTGPSLAQAADDWIIRARAIQVAPTTRSVLPLEVSSEFAPELDFTKMIGSNFGIELILATTKHDIELSGSHFGKTGVLPPTLTFAYHFDSISGVKPYLGMGLNYTIFYGVELPAGYDIRRHSLGMAAQAGLDYELSNGWLLNFDMKKIYIQTDVKSGAARADVLQINPWVYALGIGHGF